MTIRALIIEDDENIARSIEHIVKALPQPHDSAWAGDIATARKKILSKKFNYLILDMNLPLEPGRATGRRENGRNLLEWIRGEASLKSLPVIVVTGEDKGESDFILSVMQVGGMDRTRYMQKPIDGEKLEKEIRSLLAASPAVIHQTSAQVSVARQPPVLRSQEPTGFQGGELVFFDDSVRLMGVEIISDAGHDESMQMLRILRRKSGPRFVRISGTKLATQIRPDALIGTVTGCAKTIRTNIINRLREHANVICGKNDVLVNDTQGYHLNDEKITVRDADERDGVLPVAATYPAAPGDKRDGPSNDPGDKADDPGDTKASARQSWILEQVACHGRITRQQLQDTHKVSVKTAKRDFSELTRQGKLEFVRNPHPGYYRRLQTVCPRGHQGPTR